MEEEEEVVVEEEEEGTGVVEEISVNITLAVSRYLESLSGFK